METLGQAIKRWRNSKSLSQSAVGAMIGVDGQTISNVETGITKSLKLKHLAKLREVMGEAFPGEAQDGQPPAMTLELSDEVMKIVRAAAAERGLSVEDAVEQLLMEGTDARRALREIGSDRPPPRSAKAPKAPPTLEEQAKAGQSQDAAAKLEAERKQMEAEKKKKPDAGKGGRAAG